jgi:hypothetical protein
MKFKYILILILSIVFICGCIEPQKSTHPAMRVENVTHGHPAILPTSPHGLQMATKATPNTPRNMYALNWAGYAINGKNGAATDVVGSWTVPSVSGGWY